MSEPDFQPLLATAACGETLSAEAMTDAMTQLLSGAVSDVQAAGFLTALSARGETIDEIAAAARVMRAMAEKVNAPEGAIDTCGTGGDGAGTYNISTAAALVAAGAGVCVAKHGNKAASSKSGSSDVLAALGVNLQASPAQIATCLTKARVGFMFAPAHHQAVANVARVRSELKVRTLFNLLGPLSNPAGAKRQLMGVYKKSLLVPLAETLLALGAEAAWVVHGADGLDELTTTGPSYVAEIRNGAVREFTLEPRDFGLSLAQAEDLAGGLPDDNAQAVRDLLAGAQSAYRDIVLLNAAAAIVIGGKTDDLSEALSLARRSIDDGNAANALQALVEYSHAEPTP